MRISKKMIVSTALVASLMSMPAWADEMKTETIGNINYSVPESSNAHHTQSGTMEQNLYNYDDSIVLVQYVKETPEEGSSQADLVKHFADTFTDLAGYTSTADIDLAFETMPANMKIFSYESGGTKYDAKAYVVYTGEGTAAFMYSCPQSSENTEDAADMYSKMTGSVKTRRLTDDMTATDSTQEEPQTEEETEPPVQKEFAAGTYSITEQMPEGDYTLFASSPNAFVTLSKSKDKSDVVFDKSFDNVAIVHAQPGSYVEFAGADAVLAEPGQEVDMTKDGVFLAGTHFVSGTFDLEANDGSGYFCVYKDTSQKSVVSEGLFENIVQVTVEDGNCLELRGCHFKETPTVPEKEYTDKSTIKQVQKKLADIGYEIGNIDGIAGAKTRASIEKYAADNYLTSKEKITSQLLDSLNITY